jgi:hypothetical protein
MPLDFNSTGESQCLLAFSENERWHLRSARLRIDCGFLDSVEVDGRPLPLAMGPFGANATLYFARNLRSDPLGQTADLSLVRWSDGLIVESNEHFLNGVEVEGP